MWELKLVEYKDINSTTTFDEDAIFMYVQQHKVMLGDLLNMNPSVW